MDVFDAIKQDQPYTAYAFAATASSFNNIFGGNPAVTSSGSSINVGSTTRIVAGNTAPLTVGADTLKIPFILLAPTLESNPFSLEIWFRPFNNASEISLLSHSAAYDGLTFDGTNINFKLKFATAATAIISYAVPSWTRVYHVVGTWDGHKMTLYVNNVVVGTYSLTTAQAADVFATPASAFVYAGQNVATTQKVIIDAPAIYHLALNADQVSDHYTAGHSVIDPLSNVTKRNGMRWDMTDEERNILLTDTLDWELGLFTNTFSGNGMLKPQLDTTFTSLAGNWIGSFPIYATDDTSLAGVKVEWIGTGSFTVQGSIDGGTTWATLTNGQLVTSTIGLDTTNKTLDIKVSFTGSILNDASALTSLYCVAYNNYIDYPKNQNSRIVTLSGAASTATVNEPIIQLPDRMGLNLYGGVATISTDTTGAPQNIGTVELWVKITSLSGTLYSDGTNSLSYSAGAWSAAGATKYVDGVLTATASMPTELNKWFHIVLTFTAHNNAITLGSMNMQVGKIAVFPQVMSATEVADLYSCYFKVPELLIDDASYSVVGTEDSTAYNIYSLDWGRIGG